MSHLTSETISDGKPVSFNPMDSLKSFIWFSFFSRASMSRLGGIHLHKTDGPSQVFQLKGIPPPHYAAPLLTPAVEITAYGAKPRHAERLQPPISSRVWSIWIAVL